MKFKSKVKLLLTLLISCVLFAILSVGCSDKKGPNDGDSNDYIQLNQSQVTVLMGQTVLLEAKYNYRDNTELVFTIDDGSVASVSETGLVMGLKVGEATVTATYGESSATCKVKVESQGIVPSLDFIYGVDDEATCFVDDGINLEARIIFDDIVYTDMAMSYEISDDSIAEVDENGLLIAKKAGETDVTVTASWRDFIRTKTFSVTVLDKIECYLNGGETSKIELYTINTSYGENTYINEQVLSPTVKVNGNDVAYTLVSLNEEVFTVEENRKIVASKAGSSTMKVAFTHSGKEYAFTYDVEVLKPIFEANTEIDLFDATKGIGENSISQVFGGVDLSDITKASAVSKADASLTTTLSFNAGDGATAEKLTGVPVNGKQKIKQIVSLENDEVIYKVTLTPYTNIITSVDEFVSVFAGGTEKNQKMNDGYYLLGNDITHSYMPIMHNSTGSDFYDELAGTFDGNGYDISGIYCRNGGLFGDVTGTIKNVSLNISIDNYGNVQNTTLGKFTSTTNLENIYLKPTSDAKTNANKTVNGLALSGMSCVVKMKNIVMDTTGLQFKASDHDGSNDWQYFNPYCTNYDIFSTNNSASKNLDKLKLNQTNVYFVTEQYLSQFSLGPEKPHAIIDAGNREAGWTYNSAYTGGIAEEKIEKVFINTFYRYDTAAAMAEATRAGNESDYADFTDTGLWAWDATNGLTWKGNA